MKIAILTLSLLLPGLLQADEESLLYEQIGLRAELSTLRTQLLATQQRVEKLETIAWLLMHNLKAKCQPKEPEINLNDP